MGMDPVTMGMVGVACLWGGVGESSLGGVRGYFKRLFNNNRTGRTAPGKIGDTPGARANSRALEHRWLWGPGVGSDGDDGNNNNRVTGSTLGNESTLGMTGGQSRLVRPSVLCTHRGSAPPDHGCRSHRSQQELT